MKGLYGQEYRNAFQRHTYLLEVFFIEYVCITMNKKTRVKEAIARVSEAGCWLLAIG
jgi:hypothetical protein